MDFIIAVRDMWNNTTTYGANIGTLGSILRDVILTVILKGNKKAFKELDLDIEKLNSDNPYETGTLGPGFSNIYLSLDEDTGEYYEVDILIVPEKEGI